MDTLPARPLIKHCKLLLHHDTSTCCWSGKPCLILKTMPWPLPRGRPVSPVPTVVPSFSGTISPPGQCSCSCCTMTPEAIKVMGMGTCTEKLRSGRPCSMLEQHPLSNNPQSQCMSYYSMGCVCEVLSAFLKHDGRIAGSGCIHSGGASWSC